MLRTLGLHSPSFAPAVRDSAEWLVQECVSEHFEVRECCPGCRSRDLQTIFSRSYAEPNLRSTLESFYTGAFRRDYHWLSDVEYCLQRCEFCGLIFQQAIPDEFLLKRLYGEWVDTQEQKCRPQTGMPTAKPLGIAHCVFLALSLVRSSHFPLDALDYGCGWGEWAQMTRAFGAEAWGTETSATRREYCLRRGIRIIDDIELTDDGFDLINLDEVLEHLPHPRATLAMLATKLRASGIVRISVPNGRRVMSYLRLFDRELRRPRGGGLYPVAPLQHLTCFTHGSLTGLAAACGLKRIKPSLRVLLAAISLPVGMKPQVRELIRPFYLRSRFCTELYFGK